MNDDNDFQDLIDAYCNGSISEEGFQKLEDALRNDPALRRDLIETRMFESDLRQYATGLNQEVDLQETKPPAPIKFLGVRPELWAMAAALMTLLAGAALLFQSGPTTDGGAEFAEGKLDYGVAVLSREDGAEWKLDEDAILRPGDSMRPQTWELVAGTAEIQFYCGASVILEGPAALEITSEKGGTLHSGRLRGDVPPQARGFTILTPDVQVLDLGTSFGVEVTDGQTDVQVFDGEVQLFEPGAPLEEGKGRSLTDGQGERIQSNIKETIKVDATRFIGPVQLDEKIRREFASQRQRATLCDQDPSLVARYPFQPQRQARQFLAAHSGLVPAARTDGVIVGADWSEGRWPDKGALDFKRPSDRVRVNISTNLHAITLMAFLRIDGRDNFYNSILMSDGWERVGALHWQILRNGQIELGVYHGPNDARQNHQSRAQLNLRPSDLGRWMQVAVTYDPENKLISHYKNGQLIGTSKLNLAVPIRIGAGEIGNWTPPKDEARVIRNFNGRMDELMIFKRALNQDEIQGYCIGPVSTKAPVIGMDAILQINNPASVVPGQSLRIPVAYEATEERELKLYLTKDAPPWTGSGCAAQPVPAGTNTVEFPFDVSKTIPLKNDAYKFEAILLPVEAEYEDRLDAKVNDRIDAAPPTE